MDSGTLKRAKMTPDIQELQSYKLRASKDRLVAVLGSNRLKLDPIWENPIDDIEGPLYKQYIAKHPMYQTIYVRKSIAHMLEIAAGNLPSHWILVLRAGHRPVEVQKALLQSLIDSYKKQHSSATNLEALNFARTYVSDPSQKIPPHCAGAAVDVDALDISTGKLVDFGCPVNTDNEIAFLFTAKITKPQAGNREKILTAMLNAGFAPLPSEWWHFSYGDQQWAWFYHKDAFLYNITAPEL